MASTQPEAKITAKIIDHLRALPKAWARKVHQSRYQQGEPDVDACVAGRAVKIEVKVPGNKPTPKQLITMRRWARSGALVGWATSVEEVEDLLGHLDDPEWENPQLD